jgi:hypothetical protein
MGWEDGDYFEELSRKQDEIPAYHCPWCDRDTDLWFDRTVAYLPDGTEVGMKDRCTDCGRATDEFPEPDDYKFDVENDGG